MTSGNNPRSKQRLGAHQSPETDQYGYSINNTANNIQSSSESSPFLGAYDDLALLESGIYREIHVDDETDDQLYHRIHAVERKSVDPRLLLLITFFRHLYLRKREVLKQIFPGLHDEFVEVFKKFGAGLLSPGKSRNKPTVLTRSLSVGSPRAVSTDGESSSLRLNRFKVRTVVPGGGPKGGAQGEQGADKSAGSKSK